MIGLGNLSYGLSDLDIAVLERIACEAVGSDEIDNFLRADRYLHVWFMNGKVFSIKKCALAHARNRYLLHREPLLEGIQYKVRSANETD